MTPATAICAQCGDTYYLEYGCLNRHDDVNDDLEQSSKDR